MSDLRIRYVDEAFGVVDEARVYESVDGGCVAGNQGCIQGYARLQKKSSSGTTRAGWKEVRISERLTGVSSD